MKKQTKHHRGRRRKKTKGQIISNIVLVIAIGVFLFSGYKLFTIFWEYNKGETEYENLQEIVIKERPVENGDGDGTQEESIFRVDFEALKEMNPETVAWIRFDEPAQISYPVVKGPDNDKYLHTTFEGKRNSAGALFVDMDNSGDFTDRNTFIYGHNMKNGSMFGQLRKYKTKAFGQEHPYFYIYTPDGKEATYQIFAVSVVKDTSESYKKWYNTDEEFLDYIQYIRSIAGYKTDVEVSADSKIVSLSTCTNVSDDERLLVHGVKVHEKLIEEEVTEGESDSVEK